MNMLERVAYRVFSLLGREVCHREYLNQKSAEPNERVIEYNFALRCIWNSSAQNILDVGTGTSPWPALLRTCGYVVTAIDEMGSYWHGQLFNRHFYIIKDDITHPKLSKTFDLITCISTLEHISNPQNAIRGMFSLLKRGGYLCLPFPIMNYTTLTTFTNCLALATGKTLRISAGFFLDRRLTCG